MDRKKNVAYYMSLPYRVEIIELTPEDGGGFVLELPELGRAVMSGCGETYEEAKASLEAVKEDVFEHWIQRGTAIPEPESMQTYSGKVSLRMPPELHRQIAEAAKCYRQSINQFIVEALEFKVTMPTVKSIRRRAACETIPAYRYAPVEALQNQGFKDYQCIRGKKWTPVAA